MSAELVYMLTDLIIQNWQKHPAPEVSSAVSIGSIIEIGVIDNDLSVKPIDLS